MPMLLLLPQRYEFSSKSQLPPCSSPVRTRCCCYRKGTNFQANHNASVSARRCLRVVVATAKVRIFKQITTQTAESRHRRQLLLLPQRYEFSSKSQHKHADGCTKMSCCCYRKGTNFQANHNQCRGHGEYNQVVVATAKVRIFKQITTRYGD